MCLATPSIIVSDFYANRSRFIVNMWFKSFWLPLQVFRPYFVVFLALGMFYFCEIPCKHLQNKNFPPSCCFHFANHGLLQIVHGWEANQNSGFVIVHDRVYTKMNFTRVFVTVSPRRPWDRAEEVGQLLAKHHG